MLNWVESSRLNKKIYQNIDHPTELYSVTYWQPNHLDKGLIFTFWAICHNNIQVHIKTC